MARQARWMRLQTLEIGPRVAHHERDRDVARQIDHFFSPSLGILLFADDGPQLWSQIPGLLWRYVPVLTIELALAVALATLLRGWAGSVVDATVSLLAASLVWGLLLVVVYAANAEQLPVFMRRDWNYLLLVGTAAALCTWAATRVWARADLGELMRSSRKPRGGADDDTALPLWNRR